jgi:hypothetical protein
VDRDDRILLVEFARQHRANLGGLDVTCEAFEGTRQIGAHRFALPCPVDEHGNVVHLAPQDARERPFLVGAAAALQDSLGSRLVLPEVGFGNLPLDVGQLAVEARFVKAPSGS